MKKLILSILTVIAFIEVNAQCQISINKPDTFSMACGTTDSLSVGGATVTPINNTFNNGMVGQGWSATSSAQFNNPCGVKSSTYLWMGPTSTAPRTLATNPINVACGGDVCFELKYAIQGTTSPCEGPDLANEGVDLQYRTGGAGPWTSIFYFTPNTNGNINAAYANAGNYTAWATYCFPIPAAAQTASTEFRWIQTAVSSNIFDHWGLDSVVISNNCANVTHLWNTGDTNTTIGVTALEDSTYWCRRIMNNVDTCYDTVRVESENPISHLSIEPSIPVCAGVEVELRVDSMTWIDPNVTYNKLWTPTALVDSATNDTTMTKPIVNPTTYFYSVYHPQYTQCTGTDSIRVEMDNTLVVDSVLVWDDYCNNSDGSIQVFASGGTGQYWYLIDDSLSALDTRDDIASGFYPITVIDSLTSCERQATANVLANPGIKINNLQYASPDCPGGDTTALVGINNPFSAMTYTWYKDGGVFRTEYTNAVQDFTNGLTAGNYRIIVEDSKCQDTIDFEMTEPDSIKATFAGIDTLCNQKDLHIVPTITGGTPEYQTNWLSKTSKNLYVRANQDTTVRVVITDAKGCLSDTTDIELFLPRAIETELRDTTVCAGVITNLDPKTKYGTGNYEFTWSTGWPNEVLPSGTDKTKMYWVKVDDGCLYPHYDSVTVSIFPQPEPILEWKPICLPGEMEVVTNIGNRNYTWYYDEDSIQTGNSNRATLELTGITDLAYSFQTEFGCTVSGIEELKAYYQPQADFYWNEDYTDPIYNNEISFYSAAKEYDKLTWVFPDRTVEGEFATHQFLEPGWYEVKLEAINGLCKHDTIRRIEVLPISDIWIPNSFTPNADNINDVFKPKVTQDPDDYYRLRIYNRWGNLMFDTQDPNEGWDGYYNGTVAPSGNYVYTIEFKNLKNEYKELNGNISLISTEN